jgi:hypothetical protein
METRQLGTLVCALSAAAIGCQPPTLSGAGRIGRSDAGPDAAGADTRPFVLPPVPQGADGGAVDRGGPLLVPPSIVDFTRADIGYYKLGPPITG